MENLLAYFDPGSGSLLVQAIAGGTAGLFVLARYLWESTRFNLRRRHDNDWNESDMPPSNGRPVGAHSAHAAP